MFPRVETVPFLTTEQMIEVDPAMVEDLHIDLLQMMENAGRNLAHLARGRLLDGAPVALRPTPGRLGRSPVLARRDRALAMRRSDAGHRLSAMPRPTDDRFSR